MRSTIGLRLRRDFEPGATDMLCSTKVGVIAVAAAVLGFVAACSTRKEEINRLPSPDGKVTAVLVREDGGGAAGTRVLYLYLVESSDHETLDDPILTAVACDDLKLTWSDAQTLTIGYKPRCVVRGFTSSWYRPSTTKTESSDLDRRDLILVRTEK